MRFGYRAALLLILVGLSLGAAAMMWAGFDRGMLLARMRQLARPLLASATMVVPASSVAAAGPVPPTTIGVDVTNVRNFSRERALANLAIGGEWNSGMSGVSFAGMPLDQLTPDGVPIGLPAGKELFRGLTPPLASGPNPVIRCTFAGKGNLTAHGAAQDVSASNHAVTFRWADPVKTGVWIIAHDLDARDPLRNLDCREKGLAPTARFDPAFVAWLRGFKVVRFMDWQHVNDNAKVTWATRHTPASIEAWTGDGVAVEDMVALAAETGADPWFNMPWNGDDDYVTRFAQYVHDHLPADRKIYVETANEVWNGSFPAAKQAQAEGVARGLSPDPQVAQLLRYAQRTTEVMKLWERVFADAPGRLVRVVAVQHFNQNAEIVLKAPGLAPHVDALATAPYFGLDLNADTEDLAVLFQRLNASIDQTVGIAVQQKAIAARYGKRYIAYEAGQHVLLYTKPALQERIQRDPRMYAAYKRYMDAWRTKIGDTMILFGSTGPITGGGAWGLQEYSGQPLADAPKLRAAREELAR